MAQMRGMDPRFQIWVVEVVLHAWCVFFHCDSAQPPQRSTDESPRTAPPQRASRPNLGGSRCSPRWGPLTLTSVSFLSVESKQTPPPRSLIRKSPVLPGDTQLEREVSIPQVDDAQCCVATAVGSGDRLSCHARDTDFRLTPPHPSSCDCICAQTDRTAAE